uniref:NADH-ubiquinone oxidoreductase chain 2 n=1 Tax=Dolichosciara megumiae TaxID=2715056 RepID=A0A6G7GBJ5_9DIPT|nr:NADH dehydrogenase subunit 2 [Dolichosciara megumiae]QIH95777.1 NADH dehydrogenase subunit 2 [Dolichosciara megumiae]
MNNLSKILFLMMVWLGSFMVISANSWLGLWMGLEINLLAFIPIIVSKNNLNNSEASLNYFLIQAFASTILLFSMIFLIINDNFMFMNSLIFNNMHMKLIILALMMKLGAPPFHFWFPNVMENISWINGFIMMTWQKLGPMMVLSYFINTNFIFIMFILISTFVGAIGGLNQISLRKLLAFSSINHLGWMFAALIYNETIWLMYFVIYTFMNFCLIYMFKILQIFYLNQVYSIFMGSSFLKVSLLTSMLSLGGLPPFLGFAPKWIIIQSLSFMNMNLMNLFLICMSLVTLFYYLKICTAAFLFNYSEFNFFYKKFFFSNNYLFMMKFNFLSMFGFFIIIELMYFM